MDTWFLGVTSLQLIEFLFSNQITIFDKREIYFETKRHQNSSPRQQSSVALGPIASGRISKL